MVSQKYILTVCRKSVGSVGVLFFLMNITSCEAFGIDRMVSVPLYLIAAVLLIFFLLIIGITYYFYKKTLFQEVQKDFMLQESHLLKTLIDNIPDFIYIKDKKSRFIVANKFLAETHKLNDSKDVIGKTDFDFYPEHMASKYYQDEQWIIKTKNKLIEEEEEGLDRDRKKTIVSTTKVPWLDSKGNVLGIIGLGRNITKLKEYENELVIQAQSLQEVNQILEEKHEQINHQAEELTAQAENLRRLNIELQKINETKDKFISIIAHDLKNPFNAIINFSELLILKGESSIMPKQMEMIRIINSSSKMAYSLLENLLFWGKSQNATIPFRPATLNIADLIKEVADFHEVSAKLKNIVIINEAQYDLSVFADHDMVTTILRNLLSNAIKFTPKNGEIRITSSVEDRFAYVTVVDSGLGISKNQLGKLFKQEKEITKGTSGESGTGLGLVLCKEFALRNGGDIIVKSELRKGSSFILSLPLSPEF